jgi:hypothetical protein
MAFWQTLHRFPEPKMARHLLALQPAGTNPAPLDITRLLTTITNNLVGMICRCRIDSLDHGIRQRWCHKLTGYRHDELVFNNGCPTTRSPAGDRAHVSHTIPHSEAESFDVAPHQARRRWTAGVLERSVGIRDAAAAGLDRGFIRTFQRMAANALRERCGVTAGFSACAGIFRPRRGRYLNANLRGAHPACLAGCAGRTSATSASCIARARGNSCA